MCMWELVLFVVLFECYLVIFGMGFVGWYVCDGEVKWIVLIMLLNVRLERLCFFLDWLFIVECVE